MIRVGNQPHALSLMFNMSMNLLLRARGRIRTFYGLLMREAQTMPSRVVQEGLRLIQKIWFGSLLTLLGLP